MRSGTGRNGAKKESEKVVLRKLIRRRRDRVYPCHQSMIGHVGLTNETQPMGYQVR